LTVKARAKINLGLRVLGPGPDGLHEIRTVFQIIDLHDTLRFRRARRARVRVDRRGVPSGSANLCHKALSLLGRAAGRRVPLEIEIHKEIPVGAGLGGGSSDGAATLWAANRIYDVGFGNRDLAALGRELGADVPFFFTGGTCVGEGIGDRLTPLERLGGVVFLLVHPPFRVSTRWAYARARMELTMPRPDFKMGKINKIVHFATAKRTSVPNDFVEIVARRHPVVREVLRALEGAGALVASMSGTGSTLFGVFPTCREARMAARGFDGRDLDLRIARPAVRGFVVR
jgi:4-diphosphocytidyl-2-C-methyl-D-erythritol kinase